MKPNDKPALLAQETVQDITQPSSAAMILQAVKSGATQEQLSAVMDAIRFSDSREAEKAFNADFTAMQGHLPLVRRSSKSHHGAYASLAATVNAVRPVLAANGFSFRHEVRTLENGSQEVTCIIAHEAGHSERCTLQGAPDTSGSKNAIQAMGSCNSYLRRYSLLDALGIVSGDDPDDDGGGQPPAEMIGAEAARDLQVALESLPDGARKIDQLLKKARVKTLAEISPAMLRAANDRIAELMGARDE